MAAIDYGVLEFKLHVSKLKGRFTLVRTSMDGQKDKNWLLLKKDDGNAIHNEYNAADIPSFFLSLS